MPKDEATATKWFRKAAENGYGEAQHLIGTMYSFGHGLPRDFVLAYMWNNLPAAQGGAEAAKFRDVIAEAMTAQQIAEAQKLASDWLAAHPKL